MILGLLLIAPQSLYDLVKNFEAGVALVYSASTGSIKRALDTLLAKGMIEVASVDPGGRGKKIYRTTAAGSAEFETWMTGDISGPDLEVAALPRMFFLGLIDSTRRESVLRRIQARAAADLAQLEAVERRFDTIDVPVEYREVAAYQRATLAYGIASGRHAVAWFEEFAGREGDATV